MNGLNSFDAGQGCLANVYGCNYPGTDFRTQLDAWHLLGDQIMLNEGFTQFDFGFNNFKLTNTSYLREKPAYENSVLFTDQYMRYLGLIF